MDTSGKIDLFEADNYHEDSMEFLVKEPNLVTHGTNNASKTDNHHEDNMEFLMKEPNFEIPGTINASETDNDSDCILQMLKPARCWSAPKRQSGEKISCLAKWASSTGVFSTSQPRDLAEIKSAMLLQAGDVE